MCGGTGLGNGTWRPAKPLEVPRVAKPDLETPNSNSGLVKRLKDIEKDLAGVREELETLVRSITQS